MTLLPSRLEKTTTKREKPLIKYIAPKMLGIVSHTEATPSPVRASQRSIKATVTNDAKGKRETKDRKVFFVSFVDNSASDELSTSAEPFSSSLLNMIVNATYKARNVNSETGSVKLPMMTKAAPVRDNSISSVSIPKANLNALFSDVKNHLPRIADAPPMKMMDAIIPITGDCTTILRERSAVDKASVRTIQSVLFIALLMPSRFLYGFE